MSRLMFAETAIIYEYFDCKYLKGQTLRLPSNRQSDVSFDWQIYIWPWPILKVNGHGHL